MCPSIRPNGIYNHQDDNICIYMPGFLGAVESTPVSSVNQKNTTSEPLRTCWKSHSSSTGSVSLIHVDLQSSSRVTPGLLQHICDYEDKIIYPCKSNKLMSVCTGHGIILGPWNVTEINGNIKLATDGYSIEIRLSGYYHVYSQITIRPSQSQQNPFPVSMTVRICGHPGADWTTCYWYRSTSSSRSTVAAHPVTLYVGYMTKALGGDKISVALSSDAGSVDKGDTYVGAYLISQFDE